MKIDEALKTIDKKDIVINIGKDYIPEGERYLREIIFEIFKGKDENDFDYYLLAEAIFWSIGELINNANKANNRWAILSNTLLQKILENQSENLDKKQVQEDVDYAIEHNQSDLLKKYNLENIDLTASILNLIEKYKTNSFALSEKFNKKITLTLKINKKGNHNYLTINVINNSPVSLIDKDRIEYNLNKVKEDLINARNNPFEAALQLYQKEADTSGGGFGAGLRSIVLFLKSGFEPFDVKILFTKLIQYRSAGKNTIFSIEIPIPEKKK